MEDVGASNHNAVSHLPRQGHGMTNGVEKLYDRLTPKERVSALLLALVRGDELDTQRLNIATWDGSLQELTEIKDHFKQRETRPSLNPARQLTASQCPVVSYRNRRQR